MLIKRNGFPEESELVMCTVINIQHNSIFVNIHEYDKQGMITISEIAPGRIRNIRDYVGEGRVVVCKVLAVNQERGYIDLSLRRVSEGQRREKSDQLKQEAKAEKIIEITARQIGIPYLDLYKKISEIFLKQYFYVYQAFDDISAGSLNLKDFLDSRLAESLQTAIQDKIKPKDVVVAGDLAISLWEENGLKLIKESLIAVANTPNVKVSYLGGGKYRILLKGKEYKSLEKTLKELSDTVIQSIKKHKGKVEFARVKNLSEALAEA